MLFDLATKTVGLYCSVVGAIGICVIMRDGLKYAKRGSLAKYMMIDLMGGLLWTVNDWPTFSTVVQTMTTVDVSGYGQYQSQIGYVLALGMMSVLGY